MHFKCLVFGVNISLDNSQLTLMIQILGLYTDIITIIIIIKRAHKQRSWLIKKRLKLCAPPTSNDLAWHGHMVTLQFWPQLSQNWLNRICWIFLRHQNKKNYDFLFLVWALEGPIRALFCTAQTVKNWSLMFTKKTVFVRSFLQFCLKNLYF